MKKILFFLATMFIFIRVSSQLLVWTPDFPLDNSTITITVDATKGNQGLLGFTGNVYVHVGVITNLSTSPTDWKYVKFTWGSTDAAAQATPAGINKWSYTITNIRSFFGVPGGETIRKVTILFRDGPGNRVQRNSDGSDMYVPVYDNNLAVRFNAPPFEPRFTPVPEPINKQVGENIAITTVASQSSDMKLFLNGTVIQTANGVTALSANPTLTVAGNQQVIAEAVAGAITKRDTLNFFVASAPSIGPLPPGVRDGINYEPGDTSVILVLYAPNKNRVAVIGEFTGSNWVEQSQYQMNKTPDGNRWWIRITGLTPGTEYAFQYLINGILKIADPYAEKILDPWNDPSIPAATYPGLRSYPSATSGIVSLVQTGQIPYNWAITNFNRPDKRNLLIYELLLRDFLSAHDWKTLRDTLGYLKNLGVNAIELMPFNEFEGNDSWGYNPDFYFAPDKYYGPANDLKRFIDSCHSKGIAVIMDIALNHATGLCPLAALYWDAANNRPAADNPWFNPTARHPFNVFNDFNHESSATKYFFSRVVEHWLQNYKIDGFRFDLSKGFTQVNSGTDVNAWSQYDASRVSIWKSYYDTLQLKSPGSYVILEHFAANAEEIELSNYGMLLWGNMNYNFNEASMSWVSNSNFEGAIHTVRNWTRPHLISYMESHDEERLMYRNIAFGNMNTASGYNTRDTSVALKRMEMNAAFFFSIPGPKMLWQFGELGYNYSINHCTNGNIDPGCRLDPKPIRWDFLQSIRRKRLNEVYAALMKLRVNPFYKDGFVSDRIERSLGGAFKWLKVTTDTSNLLVVGNFDLVPQTGTVTFQNAGNWYDYLEGGAITATGSAQNITLQPGEYHIYLNRNITNVITTSVTNISDTPSALGLKVYPNPVLTNTILELNTPEAGTLQIELVNLAGQKMNTLFKGFAQKGKNTISIDRNDLPAGGVYLIRVQQKKYTGHIKIVLQ